MKCIVKDCENHSNEGKFNGDICYPCHAFITNGEGVHSQVYRNTKREWVGLTPEDYDSMRPRVPYVVNDFTFADVAAIVEDKLKEKNNG